MYSKIIKLINTILFSISILLDFLGVFYSTTPSRPIQMTNVPQGPQNPPVANMSNAQNSHGLVVQSQPMEMATNTQPLQVPQQPPTAPMQIPESRPPIRKKAPIKIIDPNTGNEIVVNTNTTTPSQAPQPVSYYLFYYFNKIYKFMNICYMQDYRHCKMLIINWKNKTQFIIFL